MENQKECTLSKIIIRHSKPRKNRWRKFNATKARSSISVLTKYQIDHYLTIDYNMLRQACYRAIDFYEGARLVAFNANLSLSGTFPDQNSSTYLSFSRHFVFTSLNCHQHTVNKSIILFSLFVIGWRTLNKNLNLRHPCPWNGSQNTIVHKWIEQSCPH